MCLVGGHCWLAAQCRRSNLQLQLHTIMTIPLLHVVPTFPAKISTVGSPLWFILLGISVDLLQSSATLPYCLNSYEKIKYVIVDMAVSSLYLVLLLSIFWLTVLSWPALLSLLHFRTTYFKSYLKTNGWAVLSCKDNSGSWSEYKDNTARLYYCIV